MAAIVFTPEQSAQLLQTLGLPPDTADPDLVLATIADLATDEATEDSQPGGDTADKPPSQIAAAAKRAGLEVIDASSAEALRRDAAAGRQLIAAEAQRKVEAAVDAAIDKGKTTPARRKHWVQLIAADPGMADVLAAVPDETAIALKAIGHASNVDVKDIASAAEWFY